MSRFMLNGKPYGGSTNYASSVTCTDAEGNESTTQAEIDKNRDDIDELNKNKIYIITDLETKIAPYDGLLFVGSFGSGKTIILINGVSYELDAHNVTAHTISKNDQIKLVGSQGTLLLLIPNSNVI